MVVVVVVVVVGGGGGGVVVVVVGGGGGGGQSVSHYHTPPPTEHMVHVYTHSVLNECVAESQSRGRGGSHGSYMSPPGMYRAARLSSGQLVVTHVTYVRGVFRKTILRRRTGPPSPTNAVARSPSGLGP